MAKKINRDQKITSTSDFTVGDIIDAVTEALPCNRKSGRSVPVSVVGPFGIKSGGKEGVAVGLVGGGFASSESVCDDTIEAAGIPAGVKRAAPNASPALATSSAWYNLVLQNGEVWTPYTNRRFLPAQYLGLMSRFNGNVDAAIARCYSLKDCFRLLDTEIEKLIFLERNWKTAFAERKLFLPVETCKTIFSQYLCGLEANVNDRSKCQCTRRDGIFWRKIQGEGRVELWKREETHITGNNGASVDKVEIVPTKWLVKLNAQIEAAKRRVDKIADYEDALNVMRNYIPSVSMGTFKDADGNIRYWLPKAWKEAFKKQGAYYTLKSLVLNSHVRYTTEDGSWRNRRTNITKSVREGLDALKALTAPDVPAYVIHAILKKSIEVSGFNIDRFLRSVSKR